MPRSFFLLLPVTVLLLAAPLATAQAQAPPALPAPAPASVAPEAKAIIDQATSAHQDLKALTATVSVQTTGQPTGEGADQSQTILLAFQKPNLAKADISDKTGALAHIVSNGKTLTIYDVHAKQYRSQPVPVGTSAIADVFGSSRALLSQILGRPETLNQLLTRPGVSVSLGSPKTVDGVATDVVTVGLPAPGSGKATLTLAFGHDDHLLRQLSESIHVTANGQAQTLIHTETVSSLSPSPTLTAKDFTFTPPPGVKKAAAQAAQPPMHDPHLVAGARPFPIAAKDLTGHPLSLAQYRGKVVLMDFWATWCGPCVGEMPNVIAAYKKYHAQGFDVLGISLDKDKGALTSFIKQNKMPWRQVFDGKWWQSAVPRQYGVMSIPFGLLIGRDGKIIAVEVRGPALGPAIQAALAKKVSAR